MQGDVNYKIRIQNQSKTKNKFRNKTVNLPEELMVLVNILVSEGLFMNQSEFIRFAMYQQLEKSIELYRFILIKEDRKPLIDEMVSK